MISIIKSGEFPTWYQRIVKDPKATIFHHPAWLNTLVQTYQYPSYLVKVQDEFQDSILPLLRVKSLAGQKRWICLPFTDYYQPLIDPTYFELIEEQLIEKFLLNNKDNIEIRWQFSTKHALDSTDNVLHLLHIDSSFGKMEKGMGASHKRNIRQAMKNNLRVEYAKDIHSTQTFYGLHLLTRKKLGVPVQPWKFFKNIQTNLLDKGLGFYILIYQKTQCIAGALFLHWNNTITYKFGASDSAKLDLRPNNLVFNEAIRYACNQGYQILDFGKTEISNMGLRHFKTGWGAVELPLTYTYIQKGGTNNHENYSHRLEDLLKTIIQNSPLWVCRMIGEVFYRYYP